MVCLVSRNAWTRSELFVLVALTAIGLAVAAPAVIRAANQANETQAIGDTRVVISAEDAYAAANGGFYSNIVNLCQSGANCAGIGIPNYPASGPDFIDPDLGRTSPYLKDGYIRTFTNGPAPAQLPQASDPSSVMSYCYDSTPNLLGQDGTRSFSGTGTGHVHEDPFGAQIACPIPTGMPPVEEPGSNELAVDFGSHGLWHYDGAAGWNQLTPWDPQLVRMWGAKMAVSFGPGRGLWTYDNAGGWTQLTPWDAYDLVGQDGRLLAAFDSGRGLWSFDGAVWTQLTAWEPTRMIPYGNKVAVSFGSGRGVFLHWDAAGFKKLTPWGAYDLFDLNGQLVAAFDGGRGMWTTNVENWQLNASWAQLTNWEPEAMALAQVFVTVDVASDFGPGRGIWRIGTQLTNWDPYLLIGHNGALAAAFDQGRGLHVYQDGSGWSQLTGWEPTHLASSEAYLAVAFDQGRGLYRYDGAGWSKLTSWTAESLTSLALTTAP